MTDSKVRAVFFDFGGTLFSYAKVQGRSFYPILLEALERLGADLEPREAGRAYRRASQETFERYHPRDYYLHRDLFHDTFRRFAELVGGEATQPFLDWWHEKQRSLVYDGFELRADCVDVLRTLRADGVHVGIVSNIDDDYLDPMLGKCGLREHLDAWTSSEEARSCKPDAKIFHYSMRKAEVEPEASVFVGDSPAHDIVGARRLGMRTVLIRDDESQAPGAGSGEVAEPHYTIERLSELVPIVRAGG